jgi:hypothetical protein
MLYTIQDEMPNNNKIILGASSCYLLNLIYYSYITKSYIYLFLISSVNIASSIFWYKYEVNSLSHKLDWYLATTLIIYSYIISKKIINEFLLLLSFYFMSVIFTIYNNYEMQLCCHFIYRGFIYKIVYINLFNKEDFKLYYDILKIMFNTLLLSLITTKDPYDVYKYSIYSLENIVILFV